MEESGSITRVLHVVESLGAGSLTSVSQICNLLIDRGLEVHLLYSPLRAETPDNWQGFFSEEVIFHRVDIPRSISPIKDIGALYKIWKVVKKVNPFAVHLHCSKAGFLGRFATLFSGRERKVFYSPRGFAFLQSNLSPITRRIYWWLEKFCAALGGTLVACSEGEFVEAVKLSKDRSVLIENAVDSKKILPREAKLAGSTLVVGTTGRIGPQKNPDLFGEVARSFLGDSQIRFVWIGGGDNEYTKNLVEAGVEVLGWMERADALQHLSGLDIYLQTSLWEGMPLSVIEASLAGIPAVVTNVIGNKDVVRHSITGYVCDDKPQLVGAIKRMAGDDDLRSSIGSAAAKLAAERFSVKRMGEEYFTLYGV